MLKTPIAILIAVVTLLGGFYGGYKLGQNGTQASAASSSNSSGTRGNGAGGAGGFGGGLAGLCSAPSPNASGTPTGRGAGRGTTGTISYLGDGTLTVHNATCNTDTKVTFDSSVIVRKTVTGTTADLVENANVTVIGQRQADGSIKATSISLVPAGTGRFFGGGGSGGGGGGGG